MFKDLLINRQTYIQRDLLDQINEETLKQKQTNMSTVTESKPTVVTTQRIKPSEVLTLLKSGYTRYAKDNKGYGSIQEKYNLTNLAVQKLFKTPLLKNRKTIVPDFILEEDDSTPLTEIFGRDRITSIEEEFEEQVLAPEEVIEAMDSISSKEAPLFS